MLPFLVLAALLSEPLVVCQSVFYPVREQPRGYLGRYPDQPLLVDSDIPYDADRRGLRKRQFWNDYHSMADIDLMLAEGKSYGLDGFAFFPVAHRIDLWRTQNSKVGGMVLQPIINLTGLANVPVEKDIAQLKLALRNVRGPKVGGRPIILSYQCDRANTPERLAAKLARARAEAGGDFAFLCGMTSWADGSVEWKQTGRLSEKTVAELKERFRSYLRVADGILLDGTMANHAYENSTRVFAAAYHREICRLARETVDEPEFKGGKLLGFTLLVGHQNATQQNHTANAMGTRTLRESFENAIAARPDVLLLPEWDELSESTSWMPTLYNGYSTKRLFRYYNAVLRGRSQTVMAGDDTSVPNLILSYRKALSPGEWLYFEVVNVPDGARRGKVSVALELADADGRMIERLPVRELDEGKLDVAWWDAASEELAERTRAVDVRLVVNGKAVAGFHPIDLAPANSWCIKDVKQPLRDLAPVTDSAFGWDGDRLHARISCDEPIRHAMLVGNGWIQYIHNPASACSRFREDDAGAVFQVFGYSPRYVDLNAKDFTYEVEGATDAEWLCGSVVTTGRTYRTDFICTSSDPVYLRLPKASLPGARMTIDFRGEQEGRRVDFKGEIDLQRAFAEQSFAVGTTGSVEFVATRFPLQCRYPSALAANTAEFTVRPDADRRSMTYHVQVVTMGGKTWRSRPVVKETPSPIVRTRVFSALKNRAVDVALPRNRVPELEYDFAPRAGDVVPVKSGERHFFGAAGAPTPLVTLWNLGSSVDGCIQDGSPVLAAGNETHPRRERCDDGEWAMVFDGRFTYVGFPQETMPQWAGSRISFEVNQTPSGAARTETVLASRRDNRNGVCDIILDKGEPIVRCVLTDRVWSAKPMEIRSGVKLVPDRWHEIRVLNDAETLTLTVDGHSVDGKIQMPGIFMNTTILGGAERNGTSFFTGKVRRLAIDHALGR